MMRPTNARLGVVGFAITLAMLAYIPRVAISQAASPMSAELGLDKSQMGWIFGAFALSYALLEIPMGALGDKFGVRRVLAPLVLIWSAFTALSGAAWSFVSLLVMRFIFGAGEAGCFPNLTKMLSVWLPRQERVRAQSLMWACTRWAGAVTPPIALLVITAFGWRWGFVFFGLLGVLWVAAFWFFFKDDPAKHKGVNEAELKLLEGSRALSQESGGGWLKIFTDVNVLLLVIQYASFSFVWYFYVTWLPTYLIEAWGLTFAQAAGYAILPLLFTVTKMENALVAMILMAMASFCSDLTMPISWNTCVEIGRRYTATVAATMNMFSGLAGFAAPVLGGYILLSESRNWDALIYMMVAAACISAVCWLFLNPDKLAAKNAAIDGSQN